MKFAHLSDCHIGGWREPKLKELGLLSFQKAIEECVKRKVDFILISGDLFDTPIPQIEYLKSVAEIFSQIRKYGLRIYIIPGSHDFSASGKTMISVFEKAGLVKNAMVLNDNKLGFVVDNTGVKITGMYGRRGGLEVEDYKKIDFSQITNLQGFKIFLFHTLLTELKPKEFEMIETSSISLLPKGFDYYAGGHPHFVYAKHHEGYGVIAYPGPTFPNNFKELEELKNGSFFIVSITEGKMDLESIKIPLKEVKNYKINVEGMAPMEIEDKILNEVKDFQDKILLLRIEGKLKIGSHSDINFKNILESFNKSYVVLKNTSKLYSSDYEEIIVKERSSNDIESEIMKEHIKNNDSFEESKILEIINILDKEKNEGETNSDFSNRICEDFANTMELDL